MANSENVTVFGDLADRYDALVAYDEKALDNWVEGDGYSVDSMVLASTAKAFITFSKAFVDVGRIGNGILVEGGFKGVATDALRAANLAGGVGAVIGRGAKLLRIVQMGNTCAPVAQTNALRLAGQRFLITVEELAAKSGINLQAIADSGRAKDTYTRMISAMQGMKIPVKILSQGSQMAAEDALNMVRASPGGVVTFSIRTAAGLMKHRLYAVWSRLGGLAIRNPNSRSAIYRSLAELEQIWGKGAVVSDSPMIFIPNSVMTTMASAAETLGGLGAVAMQAIPLITVPASDEETAAQALTVREALANQTNADTTDSPSAPSQRASKLSGKYHTVVKDDWLSKLAQQYYGKMQKWPVIFAANRRTIGRDPNLVKPGQRLFIPDLPTARIVAAVELSGPVQAIV